MVRSGAGAGVPMPPAPRGPAAVPAPWISRPPRPSTWGGAGDGFRDVLLRVVVLHRIVERLELDGGRRGHHRLTAPLMRLVVWEQPRGDDAAVRSHQITARGVDASSIRA